MTVISKYANLVNSDLTEKIEEYIIGNNLGSGDRLPSERDFSQILDVSRMTLRDSIKKLCNTGVLENIHGKGTFVAQKRVCIDVLNFYSPRKQSGEDCDAVKYKLIGIEKVKAEGSIARHLNVAVGIDLYQIKRLRSVSKQRFAIETTYIPMSLCPGIEKFDLESNHLYKTYNNHYHMKLTHSNIDISIGQATFEEAEWLGISEGGYISVEKRTSFDKRDVPCEHVLTVSSVNNVYYFADLVAK